MAWDRPAVTGGGYSRSVAAQRPSAGEDRRAGERGDGRDEQKELRLVHAAPEAADITGEEIADKARCQPHAHHHREDARRRDLGHQRQPDRREIKLADGDDREIPEQPQPARLAAAGLEGGERHDQVCRRHPEAAERHLADRRRLGAARRLPRPQRDDERGESEDHEGIERLKPGGRNLARPEEEINRAVGIGVGP